MFSINDYLKKNAEKISFIELKPGEVIRVNGHTLGSETPLPIMTETLIEEVRSGGTQEEVKFSNMVNGMIYTIGMDTDFKHRDEYIKTLLSYDEKIGDYVLHLGMNSMKNQEIDDALIYFRAALLIDDKNSLARYNFAISLEERARRAYELKDISLGNEFLIRAKKNMEKIESQEMPLTYYKLGYYYKQFKEYRKSEVMWEKFLRYGKEKELLQEIREELSSIEDDVKYEEGYSKVLESRPMEGLDILLPLYEKYDGWWNLSFMIGLAFRQLGETDKAISYFEEVLKIEAGQIDSLNELGLCYAAKLNLERAIELFTEAIKIEPKNHEIICNRGMAKLQLGDLEGARQDIERAYRIDPKDEIVLACRENIEQYAYMS